MIHVPFSYQGSKLKELGRIKSVIGSNISICEPFFGSGIVTGNLGLTDSCFINEKSKDVYSIWKYTYENNSKFFQLIMEYCSEDNRFEQYYYDKRDEYNLLYLNNEYNVKRAALFYYLLMSCHAGMLRYGKKGFNTSFKLFLLNGRKYHIRERIKVLKLFASKIHDIHNEDAMTFLKSDFQTDIIYCDPPYINSVSTYENNWTDDNYNELIEILKWNWKTRNIPSLTSNYSNELFDNQYDKLIKFKSRRMAGTKVVEKNDILGIIGDLNNNTLDQFL